MTVNTTQITSGPYPGNDVADEFSYTFRVDDKTQLSVYETDDSGVQTLLTVDTDYIVNNVGVDGGGTVTRAAGALPTGYTWYIRANYTETQLTAFASQGGFFPDVHESAMDKLTFLIQQILDVQNRTFKLSDSVDIDGVFSISDDDVTRAGKFLYFDSSGDLAISELDPFYLGAFSSAPTTDNNGNPLVEGNSYFNTIEDVVYIYNGTNWIPQDYAALSNIVTYEYTSGASQVTYTGADDNTNVLSYTSGLIIVSVNGFTLPPSDYTATNGTSVVLNSAPATGSIVTIVSINRATLADIQSAIDSAAAAAVSEANAATSETNAAASAAAASISETNAAASAAAAAASAAAASTSETNAAASAAAAAASASSASTSETNAAASAAAASTSETNAAASAAAAAASASAASTSETNAAASAAAAAQSALDASVYATGNSCYAGESVPGTLPVATGIDALAAGDNAKAYETANIAIGLNSQAGQSSGGAVETDAIAIGPDSKAYETSSVAIGDGAVAGVNGTSTAPFAIALGSTSEATAQDAIAIGHLADAKGTQSVSVGREASAREAICISIGWSSQAGQTNGSTAEDNAIAIGYTAKAYELGGISIGYQATTGVNGTSVDPYGIAIGYQASATGNNSVSIGKAVQNANDNELHIGTSNTNKIVMDASGDVVIPGTYIKTTATTVAGLVAAATAGAGARSFVTDATATTFASTVVGGGANSVPVYSDGTNWLIG